ncbi:MAG: class I SAM-dependent methyltransferase [Anaerolineales bacterium]
MDEIRQIVEYYDARAKYYDDRDLSARSDDINGIREICRDFFLGRKVLEVACGTGTWTRYIADDASFVHATDINDSMLNIAQSHTRSKANMILSKADAYDLSPISGTFTAGIAAWWISHVPKSALTSFFEGLHRKLDPGSIVAIMDDTHAVGDTIARSDASGNTFTKRYLRDGRGFEIVKNFYTADNFTELLKPFTSDVEFISLKYHWLAYYRI